MKVVENSPQNARNCTIFKKFLGGACPQTPLAIARSFAARDMPLRVMYSQTPRNFKVGPPPWEILHTPLNNSESCFCPTPLSHQEVIDAFKLFHFITTFINDAQ